MLDAKNRHPPPLPLGSRPEGPVQSRVLMWNSDPYARWAPVLSTASTRSSTHHESLIEDPVLTEHYFSIPNRTLLISDLGLPDKYYTLRFACIIPGDRPLAMFTTAKH